MRRLVILALLAPAIATAVTATATSANCHTGRPARIHAIGTATAVPHVPGAIGEYPAPNAVAISFENAFTRRHNSPTR